MWFSKHSKLSKKQYEEAREADEFKIMSRDDWKKLLYEVKDIYSKYQRQDTYEKCSFYYQSCNWYPKDENGEESWYYQRIKNMLEFIGDGWGKGYIRTETVYITDNFVISDASGHHTFTELENGDLLVQTKIVTKKSDSRTITEIDGQRYDCGKWRKKVIESEYKKQLIDDSDYDILGFARFFCRNYEYMKEKEKENGNNQS